VSEPVVDATARDRSGKRALAMFRIHLLGRSLPFWRRPEPFTLLHFSI
jgi:hypothetical protein